MMLETQNPNTNLMIYNFNRNSTTIKKSPANAGLQITNKKEKK